MLSERSRFEWKQPSVRDLVQQLQQEYGDRIVGIYHLPARPPRFATPSVELQSILWQKLCEQRIERLYVHQARAIEAVARGEHPVIVTGTASGKTLCYNLPVLDTLFTDPEARALYLFPTKALAQDQMGKIRGFGLENRIPIATYDGDTPSSQRPAIRQVARLILSNPDMLHYAILPHHGGWSHFFRRLRYVVVDEIHTYRGVFGAHVAHILRRLRRLAAAYGSSPQFICCSATVGNPVSLAKTLTGLEMTVIDEDGSPKGARWILFWLPPLTGENERLSANTETTRLIKELMLRGVRHIAFVRSRNTAELVLRYVKETLRQELESHSPLLERLLNSIDSYRAGYLPEERRKIERALFEGRLLSVVATTALELGIDVGSLDGVLLNGYPGTVASFWQQVGRAGRQQGEALAVLVLQNDPLHLYLADHPETLLEHPVEQAHLNLYNPYILSPQLLCAAQEKPLSQEDLALSGLQPDHPTLKQLEQSGVLIRQGDRWFYPHRRSPAQEINIRTAHMDLYLVLDSQTGHELAQVEVDRAFRILHPEAIYLHRGEAFQILELDIERRQAWAQPVEVEYYTQPLVEVQVEVLHEMARKQQGRGQLRWGLVRVQEQVVGFQRRRLITGEILQQKELRLPPRTFETTALWWYPLFVHDSRALRSNRYLPDEEDNPDLLFYPGIHALEHLTHALLPLLTGCDLNDIEGTTQAYPSQTLPLVFFLYDTMPGGTGFAEAAFERSEELFTIARERLETCPCKEGCPACILLPSCVLQNNALDKELAYQLLL